MKYNQVIIQFKSGKDLILYDEDAHLVAEQFITTINNLNQPQFIQIKGFDGQSYINLNSIETCEIRNIT